MALVVRSLVFFPPTCAPNRGKVSWYLSVPCVSLYCLQLFVQNRSLRAQACRFPTIRSTGPKPISCLQEKALLPCQVHRHRVHTQGGLPTHRLVYHIPRSEHPKFLPRDHLPYRPGSKLLVKKVRLRVRRNDRKPLLRSLPTTAPPHHRLYHQGNGS